MRGSIYAQQGSEGFGMSEANGECPPVSAGRPDDGNWRMLSSREREYLAKVESEARRADQLGINCRWLVAQLDEIHAALCPGHIGTWQDRAQKAVEAAKIISPNAGAQAPSEAR